jgi:hypothetical protein
MSMSRAALFSVKFAGVLAAAGIAVAAPLVGTASADEKPAPPPSPTATTNGHDWIG